MLTSFRQDLRLAVRLLLKRPGFTTIAVLILALGIGANTSIFSVINTLLLKPLPYADSEQLVQVWNTYPLMNLQQASVSVPDYLDRRGQVESFEESALYFFRTYNLSLDNRPERLLGVRTTASLFSLLQVTPQQGRAFTEAEDIPGADGVVLISDGLWRSRFGSDRAITDRSIHLNGLAHQIIGVMPQGFEFPTPDIDLWKPFAMTDDQKADSSRGREFSRMLARLAPGSTIEQAQSEVDAIHQANLERFPDRRSFWESGQFGGIVRSYRQELFGELQPILLLLQGMVGLVLLIACANVANLLLTRVNSRQKELSVRSALGASRWTLARQMLIESVVLSLVGGLAGIAVGLLGVRMLVWLGVDDAAQGLEITMDATVLLFAFGLALLTGIVFGLFPVFASWRAQPVDALQESGRGNSGGRASAWQRNFLVVAEVALALILLVGAGLLGRSFVQLLQEDPGFVTEGVLLAQVSVPTSKYGDNDQIRSFYDRTLDSVRNIPGVAGAGLITQSPLSGNSSSRSYSIEGYELAEGESAPHAFFRVVDDRYFETLEIPILRGRGFDNTDRSDAPGVVLVDQTMVDKYFKDSDPIGRRLGRGDNAVTIVGVVPAVKVGTLEETVTKETIYAPYQQSPSRGMTFVVRTSVAPGDITESVRQAILTVDSELPVYNIRTMDEQVLNTLDTRRVSMTLVLAFAVVAVLLASIGLYGVLTFSVTQRTRELGTRIALGASTGSVMGMVMRQGVRLTGIGVVVGLVGALGLGQSLASLLFGVSPWDPITLVGVSVLLLAIAIVACYVPARRATRVDPMEALRYE